MKILITTDWYAPVINGVVTSVLLLQRELERLGHEVRVVTLSNSLHTYREGSVYYMGSVSANKIYPGARLRMKRARSMMRELAAWRPDVIHSQCEFSTFRVAYVLSNHLGVPIIHTYHTVYEDYTHYFSPSRRVGRMMVSAFSRWICGRTACIVAPAGSRLRAAWRNCAAAGAFRRTARCFSTWAAWRRRRTWSCSLNRSPRRTGRTPFSSWWETGRTGRRP